MNEQDERSETSRNFKRKNDKYSLVEKKALGEFVVQYKKEYHLEVQRLKGKTRWDPKRKKYVPITPNKGYHAKAGRKVFTDMKHLKNADKDYRN